MATIVGGAYIGFKTINRLHAIQSDWLEFRHVTENKGKSLSQIRNYFGFGGFIHNFQNYVSQKDRNLAGVVQRDMDELLAALATYEIVGASESERTALNDIRKVITQYRLNLAKAERLIAAAQLAERVVGHELPGALNLGIAVRAPNEICQRCPGHNLSIRRRFSSIFMLQR
ncbi:MAG: hypothetical protein IH994_08590, partial [Proteobacteria bacterium]|nr:hypothetical protein [Pseudomonadota bacterium]